MTALDAQGFRRLAVLDRGIAALRVVRAVRELRRAAGLDLAVVALHDEGDRASAFVREADGAVLLAAGAPSDGGARGPGESDLAAIEDALRAAEVDALWVTQGGGARLVALAELCRRRGIAFVVLAPQAVASLVDPLALRRLAGTAGLAVVAWSGGPVASWQGAERAADDLGYPVLVAAASPGAGRAWHVARTPGELAGAYESARADGLLCDGNAAVLLERDPGRGRHVAVHVVVDHAGTARALGLCDRTVEHRGHVVLEESPPPGLSGDLELQLRRGAVELARRAGCVGAATFEFLCDRSAGTVAFRRAEIGLPDEASLIGATTGLDPVALQLRVARGERLAGTPPAARGSALAVCVRAEDPERGFAASPGTIELLRLPTGTGVSAESVFAEGDTLLPCADRTVARLAVHGHDRVEALARLDRTLRECALAVGGGSDKGFLLALLDRPELLEASDDRTWVERMVARGEAVAGEHADLALLSAAIDAYDEDFALDRARFLAGAARGRPRVKHEVGTVVDLRHRGHAYRCAVARLDASEYRVRVDGVTVAAQVERIAPRASRLVVDGRAARVFSGGHGLERLVTVEGIPHRVTYDAGGVVRAPGPAVVLAVLVSPGDTVAAGDHLVVLEAMKMEMPVSAPFAGRVREVQVIANVQVEAGAPLVVIEPPGLATGTPAATRIAFLAHDDAPSGADPRARWQAALARARQLMLGYDVEHEPARRLAADWAALAAALPEDDPDVVGGETELLAAFVAIHSLFRPVRTPEDPEAPETRSAQEYLLTYLRVLDVEGEGLPASFLTKLVRALTLYGVHGLARTAELEDALVRIYRAHERADEQAGVVLAILGRLLDRRAPLAAEDALRPLLDRLVAVGHGRFPALGDLARAVRHRWFDEPLLERARREVYAAAESTLAQLVRESDAGARAALVQALVDCPQPLVGLLLRRFAQTDATARERMLEVLTRRYYRMRTLEELRHRGSAEQRCTVASYLLEGRRIHLVASFAEYAGLEATLLALRPLIEEVPPADDVIVDLFVHRTGALDEASREAERLRDLVERAPFSRALRRVVFAIAGEGAGDGMGGMQHFTIRPGDGGYVEDLPYRGLHPMMGKRLHLWRLANFAIERLPAVEDVYLFRGVARSNPRDERLFALAEVRDLTAVRDASGRVVQLPRLECMLIEALAAIRQQQVRRKPGDRLLWNRVLLYVWPPLELARDEVNALVRRLAPATEGLGIEQVAVRARMPDPATGTLEDTVLRVSSLAEGGLDVVFDRPPTEPLRPLGPYEQKVVSLRRRGLPYPYEIVRSLTAPPDRPAAGLPPGAFVEYDLDASGELSPVERPYGENTAHVVVGVIRNFTVKHPEGMTRVILLGDPSKEMGSVAEPECRRILAALALARRLDVPLEWFTLSAGAKISMESGTENMDWIARVLRGLIEFTQEGREVNVVVVGINVGAQPYWNAEATMLMHTRGILVMTPESAMVLTGKQALDYSGSVSAEDNLGIGGYERVMGPNGQAQFWAADLGDACRILLRHYEHTYVAPGERWPRRAATSDPVERDVRTSPHLTDGPSDFATVGDIVSREANPGRKKPFAIRAVMRAVADQDQTPLERWTDMRDAEIAVIWDAHVGGRPVCMIGIESHPLRRFGPVPAEGPEKWTAGTLFPRSSKKIARAINTASANRPLLVLANLSGFDGSPESMRNLQLEYGAEIGRSVVNFRGPIVFCVISRYHGGAFVVFSKALNEGFEAAALEGAYASVIGGAPAAAVVFAREVDARTGKDARIEELERAIAAEPPDRRAVLRARLATLREQVRSEKLGEVADEFDHVHSVQRALRVGSLDHIVPPARLRPYLIDAIERGMAAHGG